jgi:hypothetical protein
MRRMLRAAETVTERWSLRMLSKSRLLVAESSRGKRHQRQSAARVEAWQADAVFLWGQAVILRGDHCTCSACHELFNSTAAFDKHRFGEYGNGRRCLTVEEMLAKGMSRNSGGWWVTAALKMAPAYLHGNSRNGDQAEGASP